MSISSIKLKHIVNDIGSLNIDVFKDIHSPDVSKLTLNCNGKCNDSLKINCPNGGIFLNSKNIYSESDNLFLNSKSKININSYDVIKLNSLNGIELGKDSSIIFLDFLNNILNVNFTEYLTSSINLQTNDFVLFVKNNLFSINKNIILKSDNNIYLGNNYNNTIHIDCKHDNIYMNGDIYINGKLFIKDDLINCKIVENVVNDNQLTFNLNNSVLKDWAIIGKYDNYKNGIYFTDKHKLITFKSDVDTLNVKLRSLFLGKDVNIDNTILNAGNEFILDNKYNLNMKGSINISGNININDTIYLDNKGILKVKNDIILHNLSLKKLFQYSVGKMYTFNTIQQCINYIEDNNLYLKAPIFIEIYPDKIYHEDIIITKPNINIIGKDTTIHLMGSISIDYREFNVSEIILYDIHIENICIKSRLSKNNKLDFAIHDLHNKVRLKNVSFILDNCSNVTLLNCSNIYIDNCVFTCLDNKSILIIKNVHNIFFSLCTIKLICKLEIDKIIIMDSEVNIINIIWTILSKIINFIRCEILVNKIDLLKTTIIRNNTCFIFNSVN